MSGVGLRGRGSLPRGRKVHGLNSGIIGARNAQPNFNLPRRESHVPPPEFWLEHSSHAPWQQINGHPPPQLPQYAGFEPHRYRGRPPFCPGLGMRGRSKRIRGEARLRPGSLSVSGFSGLGLARPQQESLRFPPLGSEEERQQKIAETADKLKQKLSSLTFGEPVNFWEDDLINVSFSHTEEHVVTNRGIPELRHDPPELNLTSNDFKDIGRVDPDSSLHAEESPDAVVLEKSTSRVQGAEENSDDPKPWLQTDLGDRNSHKNGSSDAAEPPNTPSNLPDNDNTPSSDETGPEIHLRHRRAPNCDKNDLASGETKQAGVEHLNYTLGGEKNASIPKQRDNVPAAVEKEAVKVAEKESSSSMKPELTKSLEKLREVIKNDRELEKEAKAGVRPDCRPIFQPRLQPDIRLDFHSGIGPGYSRFQGFAHSAGLHEMRNRFRPPFRAEHPIETHQNFPPEFRPRFEHRPDVGHRNFNPPQRLPYQQRIQDRHPGSGHLLDHGDPDLQRQFDPRAPPPRFNVPLHQDPIGNPGWFDRNEFAQEFAPPSRLNELQPPLPGFDPRGPPPRFMNQNQDFGPNIGPQSMGYPGIPPMHIPHQPSYVPIVNRSFNPIMPPPNTAPCIIQKFLPVVPHPLPVDNQATLQPPPIPTGALEIQSNVLPRPPSPPNLTSGVNEEQLSNKNCTPNMNDELEDMQEALEFAKKLMNMTDEEDDALQSFNMPTFPDLPPIPSTEPSHIVEKVLPAIESGDLTQADVEKGEESALPLPLDDLLLEKEDVTMLDEQMRPKVVFNLNSRTKKIAQVEEWRNQHNDYSLKQRKSKEKVLNSPSAPVLPKDKKECESPCAESRVSKLKEVTNDKKNKQRESRDSSSSSQAPSLSGENLGPKESGSESSVEIGSKTPEDNVTGRASSSKAGNKSLLVSTVDANWKDKVINQFLKMSKNDICNMVNSSGLRKFDIAMKHLVKERKYSLSQERRSSADDAVKGNAYDMSREEFMSQLSAMLDPSATVDVKNLPSKFIQHLSEVLKLDVESHLNEGAEQEEPNEAINNIHPEDHLFSNYESQGFTQILEDPDPPSYYSTEQDLTADVEAGVEPNQEMQAADVGQMFNSAENGNTSVTESPPYMPVGKDTISKGVARSQEFVAQEVEVGSETNGELVPQGFIRARCTRSLISEKNLNLDDLFSAEIARANLTTSRDAESHETPLEAGPQVEIENDEGWGGKKHQDPIMFRNLTKEEWEAKFTKAADKECHTRSKTPSSRDTSLSARLRNSNLSPLSPLKSEIYQPNLIVHTPDDAKDKWSKATEDELATGNASEDGTNYSSISSHSDESASRNVTKLLKVIKEREKIAKNMSQGETMRDKVAAEIERAKGSDRERQADKNNRRREKNRRKKEHRAEQNERKKTEIKEIDDGAQSLMAKENLGQEDFIKQEELIIEADTEEFLDCGTNLAEVDPRKNPSSHLTTDKNEENLSEMSFHELNEVSGHSDGNFNTREMLVAQEYAIQESKMQVQDDKATQSFVKDAEIDGSASSQNPAPELQSKETKHTTNERTEVKLSKSGAKKIDIQAYKARKMQRNNEKQEKLKEIEARSDSPNVDLPNTPCSSHEAEDMGKETQKESVSGDSRLSSKLECDERNTVSEPTSSKELMHDSSARSLHREKSPAPKSKSEKREDKKPSKVTSAKADRNHDKEKGRNCEDKLDKQQRRNHSRDSARSMSQEDRQRSRERSRHSRQETTSHNIRRHKSSRSASLPKVHSSHERDKSEGNSAPRNNSIVESRDRESTKRETHDSRKEVEKRIEKGCSSGGKYLSEDKSVRKQSPSLILKEVAATGNQNDSVNNTDCDSKKETTDVGQKHEEISTNVTETAKVSRGDLESTSAAENLTSEDIQTRENNVSSSPQDKNTSDCIESRETEEALGHNEELGLDLAIETTSPDIGFNVKEFEKKTVTDYSTKEEDLTLNDMKEPCATHQKILESKTLIDWNEFGQNEAELLDKISCHQTEKIVEFESPELEDELKNIVNDLLDKAIFQLDLLSGKNQAVETTEVVGTEVLEPKQLMEEFNEYATLEFSSPEAPESPLKGFSEESIKTSLLGKRKLTQSMLEITEDFMLSKRAKKFDDIMLDMIAESASIPNDNQDLIPKQDSEEIDGGLEKPEIQALDSLRHDVCPVESESSARTRVCQEEEEKEPKGTDGTCMRSATPSGDTLSLGSSIDFDNGEFIVLSEISSDENFSHDEDRRLQIARKHQSFEDLTHLASAKEPEENEAVLAEENMQLNDAATIDGEMFDITAQTNIDDAQLEQRQSISSGKLESSSTLTQSPEESATPITEETCNSSKFLEAEATSSCNLISKKTSGVDNGNGRKKSSVTQSRSKKTCKSSERKSIDASSKDISAKNLHRVKHRHRMKRKKDEKCKLSAEKVNQALRDEDLVTVAIKPETREGVMARMIEIDLEIHKLTSEKLQLYKMLKSGDLPNEEGLLSIGIDGPEPLLYTENVSWREPQHRSSNNENCRTPTKQKSSGSSKAETESMSQKSSKTSIGCISEDDSANRYDPNQKNTAHKKSKKSQKRDRPSRKDNAAQTEPRKSSVDRRIDTTNSSSKRRTTDKKSTSKKNSQSLSTARRREEEALRKEEQANKNLANGKESFEEDLAEVSQKSKKAEHHGMLRKKASKIPDLKDDPVRRVKKDDETEPRSRIGFETQIVVPEKHDGQIYSDESSQFSLSQEWKGGKKCLKGLVLLEESYMREKAIARKHRAAISKGKKSSLRSLTVLSNLEEEMPLNLLYIKKFPKKQRAQSINFSAINSAKIKRATSAEVQDHVLEAINAVAENKVEEYQRSSKMKSERDQTLNIEAQNVNRKTKAAGKPNLTHKTVNPCARDEFEAILRFEDIVQDTSRVENLVRDNLMKDWDDCSETETVIAPKSAASPHEYEKQCAVDKMMEISEEINAGETERNKFKAERTEEGRTATESVSMHENCYDKGISDVITEESGKTACPQWESEDILRSNRTDNHKFNYTDHMPEFGNPDSALIPQDQTPHSHSISRDFKDIEKGLDVLDSMLETVGSDLESISSKNVSVSSSVKKGKRKRKVSGNDGVAQTGRRAKMTRSEMMNCSVKLVDCKYTHLKDSGPCCETTNPPQSDATILEIQNTAESRPQTPKSKSPSSLTEQQLNSGDKDCLIPGSELGLNNAEGNPEYGDDDFEVIKLQASAAPEEVRSLDKVKTDHMTARCSDEVEVILDSEQRTSPQVSQSCLTPRISPPELKPRARSGSKLEDVAALPQTEAGKVDRTKEGISTSENTVITKDVEVINPSQEIEEVEPPRIQYSVHKGPILDVKVFGDSILAASEDGVIYRYSQTCNGILNTYEGHKSAVTCIYVLQETVSSATTIDLLFSGSLDGSLRCFDIKSSLQVRGAADVGSPIQCMDQSWGVIFLGTKSGYVFRFHIKSHAFKGDEIKFSEESVLALKATTEGPRRVLIVASRSQPITIRDAQNGLFLRTVSGHKSHTVYSLMMDSNLVYCGTSSTAIPVFDFINGSQVKLYNAGPGIVCMRMYKWLLFAGCYDGNIYVFDTKEQRLVCSIPGPGNMLLSMDIFKNKVVAGSKDRRLHIWQMPEQVLALIGGRT